MATYVALLRAVNVGGRKLPMAALRDAVEALGHEDVRSYVQSGNLVLRSTAKAADVASGIEGWVSGELGVESTVIVLGVPQMRKIVDGNPFLATGADPKVLHATLLAAPPAAAKVGELAAGDHGREEIAVRGTTVYLHMPDGYGRAKLNNAFVERRLGVPATTRNWRTMTTLLEMATGEG